MALLDTMKSWGGRWRTYAVLAMVCSSIYTFTGPTVSWAVKAYADETLDNMLRERGITKESFLEVQKKLKEIDGQTEGVKSDLTIVKAAINKLVTEQAAAQANLELAQKRSADERRELKDSVDLIYKFLITGKTN